jgi:hypothetical protein
MQNPIHLLPITKYHLPLQLRTHHLECLLPSPMCLSWPPHPLPNAHASHCASFPLHSPPCRGPCLLHSPPRCPLITAPAASSWTPLPHMSHSLLYAPHCYASCCCMRHLTVPVTAAHTSHLATSTTTTAVITPNNTTTTCHNQLPHNTAMTWPWHGRDMTTMQPQCDHNHDTTLPLAPWRDHDATGTGTMMWPYTIAASASTIWHHYLWHHVTVVVFASGPLAMVCSLCRAFVLIHNNRNIFTESYWLWCKHYKCSKDELQGVWQGFIMQ